MASQALRSMIFYPYDWSLLLHKNYRDLPDCVLEEICRSYNLNDVTLVDIAQRERTINIIRAAVRPHYKTVTEWLENNCDVQTFLRCTRRKAYQKHMLVGNYYYGNVKYDEKKRYSALFLYWHCLQQKLPITNRSSVDDMRHLLHFQHHSDDMLRNIVLQSLPFFSRDKLLELTLESSSAKKREAEEYSPQALRDMHANLQDVETLQSGIHPSRSLTAVSLAAIRYHTDISMMSDPVVEYQILERTVSTNTPYHPHDDKIRSHYDVNPQHYNLLLRFNPLFPACYYTEITLRNHALMYGKVLIGDEDLYLYCSTEHERDHFYVGACPNSEEETLTACDIRSVPPNLLFSYSTHHITCEELLCWWKKEKQFLSPYTRDIMPKEVVTRLRQLLFYDIIPDIRKPLQESEKMERQELLHLIESITLQNDVIPKISTKGQVYLRKILKLGMFMRGWDGKGGYPLSSGDCYGKEKKEREITRLLMTDLRSLPEEVANMELYLYHHGVYIRDSGENNTLGKRLELLRQEDIDHPDACIRTSSNYLVATSYRAVKSTLFDIRDLDYIH